MVLCPDALFRAVWPLAAEELVCRREEDLGGIQPRQVTGSWDEEQPRVRERGRPLTGACNWTVLGPAHNECGHMARTELRSPVSVSE